ncbi:hypothetical protein [Runella sp.]|uniref:hypothetical protein n=1 Tax=Runella sp. TaxID=1960881 RepID=UPI003D10BD38
MTKLLNLIRSVGQKFNAPINQRPLRLWQFWLLLFIGFSIGMPLGCILNPSRSFSTSRSTLKDSTQFYKTLYLAEKSNVALRSRISTLERRQERLKNDYEKAIDRIDSLRGIALQREIDRVFGHAK